MHVIDLTHAGISTVAFAGRVEEWIHSARHPRFGRPYDDSVYQPMREVRRVFASVDLTRLRLEAFKNYYIPDGDLGLSGIVASSTPALIRLQQDVIDAVAPFTVDSGTSSAFVTTPDDLFMNPALIEYVSAFVPTASGDHFSPHVTTGVASREFLDHMLEESFESFEFGLIGAAVYQLGQFGTAAKKLKSLRVGGGEDSVAGHGVRG